MGDFCLNHMSLFAATALAVALAAPISAHASPATDTLSQCLVENASPKDQANLVRWMFSGLSLNPSLKSMTNLTAAERDTINKSMAATFERLMMEDCRTEVIAAMKADGDAAIRVGFEVMGRRAAEQLMSDPASDAEMGKLSNYLDAPRWEAFVKEVESKKR